MSGMELECSRQNSVLDRSGPFAGDWVGGPGVEGSEAAMTHPRIAHPVRSKSAMAIAHSMVDLGS